MMVAAATASGGLTFVLLMSMFQTVRDFVMAAEFHPVLVAVVLAILTAKPRMVYLVAAGLLEAVA